MGQRSNTSKNLVIAFALLGAVGILAVRRLPRLLGETVRFTDGSEVYGEVRGDDVRHAVWDTPLELGAEINSPAREARPAISPDGRWLVFASQGEAADWDLWIAELDDGVAGAARPLALTNSAADDLAPAFGAEGLYLSSNRPGGVGGFDLWLAPFSEGQVGEARLVEGALNTAFDELDPAPGVHPSGEPLLVFASDRGLPRDAHSLRTPAGGLDLFVHWPLRTGSEATRALSELNTPADEREPCLAPDGESLFFASNAGGAFALARSFRDGEHWLAARPLAGLKGIPGARAPALTRDGFTLYFEAPRFDLTGNALDPGDLRRAHSRELFPLAPTDLGWKDLLLVALLLVTALLAWLAKRWHELDALYKCFLLSVLLHLILMWFLRDVRPEAGVLPVGPDEGPTFRVQVLRDSSLAAAQSEQAGALAAARGEAALQAQPSRLALDAPLQPLEFAPAVALEARASALAQAPSAQTLEALRPSTAQDHSAPQLAAPSETFERYAELASGPELEAPAALDPAQRLAAGTPGSAPARAQVAPADASRAAPEAPALGALARPAAAEVAAPGKSASASERATDNEAAQPPRLAALEEHFVPYAVVSAEVAGPTAQAFEPSQAGAERSAATPLPVAERALAGAVPGPAAVAVPQGAEVARRSEPARAAPAARQDAPSERSQALAAAGAPALAVPTETFAPLTRGEHAAAPAPLAAAAQSFAPERTARAERPAPARIEAPVQAQPEASAAAPVEALAARPRIEDQRIPEAPGRLFDTPYRTRFGAEKSTALQEHGGGDDTEAAVARGLAYLASIQNSDGSWGRPRARHAKYHQVAIGKTGLALLAFLGAGHTPGEGSYARVADGAVTYLLGVQSRSSGHFGDSDAYGHGIATYALAECFALTREERLRAPLEAALQRILEAQFTRGDARLVGGWSYFYRDDKTFDEWPRVSISAWQVMALESGRLGGLEVPDGAFDAAREFLLRSWDPRMGAFRYSHDPARTRSNFATLPGSTPAALFALALLGEDLESDPYRPARDYLSERAPAGYRYRGDDAFVQRASGNLYFWYYGTLASFRLGGRPWQRWNTALKETLLPSQEADGSWVPLDIYAREYAGDRDGDRSYTTALNVLSLEVYYRYFTPLLRVR